MENSAVTNYVAFDGIAVTNFDFMPSILEAMGLDSYPIVNELDDDTHEIMVCYKGQQQLFELGIRIGKEMEKEYEKIRKAIADGIADEGDIFFLSRYNESIMHF